MYQGQNNYKLWDIHTKLFSQKSFFFRKHEKISNTSTRHIIIQLFVKGLPSRPSRVKKVESLDTPASTFT